MADLLDIEIETLDGKAATLGSLTNNQVTLAVNVASKCGLTPQYSKLEALQAELGPKGFTVLGFPCNQFGGQEPGSSEEIAEFCSATYGVTFPMTEKIDVNGPNRHPVYDRLTQQADAEGNAGDIQWNFEKFLLDSSGQVVARFRPQTEPDAPEVITAINGALGLV